MSTKPDLVAAWRDVQTPLGRLHFFVYSDDTWSDEFSHKGALDSDVVWGACVLVAQQGAFARRAEKEYGSLLLALGKPDYPSHDGKEAVIRRMDI